MYLALQIKPSCFLDQQALLLITLLRPSFSGLSEFSDLFPNKSFCWELLGLCPRADRVPTISWIITKCLFIHLAASDFFYSDRINHPTRSKRRTLWKCQHPRRPPPLPPLGEVDKLAGEALRAYRQKQLSCYRFLPKSYPSSSNLWSLYQASKAEPSRAKSRQTASQSGATVELSCEETSWTVIQSGPARPTAQSLPSNERITRILEPLPISGKLRGVSETPSINQKEFRIELHTLGTWTRHVPGP